MDAPGRPWSAAGAQQPRAREQPRRQSPVADRPCRRGQRPGPAGVGADRPTQYCRPVRAWRGPGLCQRLARRSHAGRGLCRRELATRRLVLRRSGRRKQRRPQRSTRRRAGHAARGGRRARPGWRGARDGAAARPASRAAHRLYRAGFASRGGAGQRARRRRGAVCVRAPVLRHRCDFRIRCRSAGRDSAQRRPGAPTPPPERRIDRSDLADPGGHGPRVGRPGQQPPVTVRRCPGHPRQRLYRQRAHRRGHDLLHTAHRIDAGPDRPRSDPYTHLTSKPTEQQVALPHENNSDEEDGQIDETEAFDLQTGGAYTGANIEVLEGLKAVRKRPGMYIGNTDVYGLHHMVYELVDNSVDEALAGHCDRIEVVIHSDSSVTVSDNGRGIPVDMQRQMQKSALEVVMTILHAGGKFGGGGYKVSSGLHGVGASVVNALSEWMRVEVRKDGGLYVQEYMEGIPLDPVERIGDTTEPNGTTITFMADQTIFTTIDYNFDTLAQRFREMCYLTKGLTIALVDERPGVDEAREWTFYFEGGIVSFVRHLNLSREPLHKPFYVDRRVGDTRVEVALQYNDSFAESVYTFANNINTIDGGSHLSGFRSALTRSLNDYARRSGILKDSDANLSGDDVREGLTAVISVKVLDPQFESQTKNKLNNAEVGPAVQTVV